MRRTLGLVVILSIALIPAVAALAVSATYADDFSGGNYAGNDGSSAFSGPWQEFGDTGGPSSGRVHVDKDNCSNNRCLHLEGSGLVLTGFGAQRYADLTVLSSAELTFDIHVVESGSLLPTNAWLNIEATNGSGWVTLASYSLSSPFNTTKTISLNDFLSSEFGVRFTVPGSLTTAQYTYATVDNVAINESPESTTTTSSTTSTSSSTTSTSTPTTTSTSEPTTTSTSPTTTSTHDDGTTSSTTDPGTTGTTRAGEGTPTTVGEGTPTTGSSTTTTTTRAGESTSTTLVLVVGEGEPPQSEPFDGGLRDTGVGLMSDYHAGMNGEMFPADVEVLSAEVTADFSLAVERIGNAKIWVAGLALMIAAAIVSGMDSRRSRRVATGTPSA